MSRRGSLIVFVTLSLAACRGTQNNPFGAVQSRPPSADSVLVFVSGSWATEPALARPSFRNWFQPHYPYVFSKFRCASSR